MKSTEANLGGLDLACRSYDSEAYALVPHQRADHPRLVNLAPVLLPVDPHLVSGAGQLGESKTARRLVSRACSVEGIRWIAKVIGSVSGSVD